MTLVEQGHAWRTPEGGIRAPKDLIARLERQEIARAGKSLEGQTRLPFRVANEGERVSGVFTENHAAYFRQIRAHRERP